MPNHLSQPFALPDTGLSGSLCAANDEEADLPSTRLHAVAENPG